MREATKFLQNLVYRSGYLKATIKEGVAALKPYAKQLEVIHIRIPHYLVKQDGFNKLEYIERKYRTVLTPGFGSNFDLEKHLYREIRNNGFYWKTHFSKI